MLKHKHFINCIIVICWTNRTYFQIASILDFVGQSFIKIIFKQFVDEKKVAIKISFGGVRHNFCFSYCYYINDNVNVKCLPKTFHNIIGIKYFISFLHQLMVSNICIGKFLIVDCWSNSNILWQMRRKSMELIT